MRWPRPCALTPDSTSATSARATPTPTTRADHDYHPGQLDAAASAVCHDLEYLGLADSTLVVTAGEFGRRPEVARPEWSAASTAKRLRDPSEERDERRGAVDSQMRVGLPVAVFAVTHHDAEPIDGHDGEGVLVGEVIAGEHHSGRLVGAELVDDPFQGTTLVPVDVGSQLDDGTAAGDPQALVIGGDRIDGSGEFVGRVGVDAAVVHRDGVGLVFDGGPGRGGHEAIDSLLRSVEVTGPRFGIGMIVAVTGAVAELEAVAAGVPDAVEADAAAHVVEAASADHRDRAQLGERAQRVDGAVDGRCGIGIVDDAGQGAVEVARHHHRPVAQQVVDGGGCVGRIDDGRHRSGLGGGSCCPGVHGCHQLGVGRDLPALLPGLDHEAARTITRTSDGEHLGRCGRYGRRRRSAGCEPEGTTRRAWRRNARRLPEAATGKPEGMVIADRTHHHRTPASASETERDDAWTWAYRGYEPDEEKLREALCAVGNGYLATRGALPESSAGPHHYPGTYAAGIFDRQWTDVAGHQVPNESMVNLPNWLPVTFRVDDGPWYDLDELEVVDHELRLDLRHGVLTRCSRTIDAAGRRTTVTQRRFVHMEAAHVCGLATTIVADDWSGTVTIRSGLDATVTNDLVDRYRDLEGCHLEAMQEGGEHDTIHLEARTRQSGIRIALAARHRMTRNGERIAAREQHRCRPGFAELDLTFDLGPGDAATMDKVVTVYTGRDRAIGEPDEQARRVLARLPAFGELMHDHRRAWERLWDRFDVTTDGPTPEWLPVVRLHLAHVLSTVSPNTVGLDAGIPARGLTGEAYRGHILWDELFVLPLLTPRLPALSRSLLMYRFDRLPEARAAARSQGHAGAMFPWQSGSDGREESQTLHLNPKSGRWVPDPTRRQRHVGLAIAYNVWQYFQTTADLRFLTEYGAEMLWDIARFFSSLAELDDERGRYVICGVMGPDEFHSGYPGADEAGIDNNAYTNVMAVWVLKRALDALDAVPSVAAIGVRERLGIDEAEVDRWRDITARMYVPFHDEGIISQFEGYGELAELDWEGLRERHGDIARLDRVLEAEGDSVNRYKASKQADVLMLLYLLSVAELREILDDLGYRFDDDQIERTIDHYLARSSHGSTLSAVVHAWVLTRAHRDHGVELFFRALSADVADIQGGTTPEGIHLAAMAGSVDLLQRCFAGLETRGGRLHLRPLWPEGLGTLRFSLVYRDHPLQIAVSGRTAEVTALPCALGPIEVTCRGQTARVESGSTVRFDLGERSRR